MSPEVTWKSVEKTVLLPRKKQEPPGRKPGFHNESLLLIGVYLPDGILVSCSATANLRGVDIAKEKGQKGDYPCRRVGDPFFAGNQGAAQGNVANCG
ncbi:MAG TPA: hypothetical protein GXX19_06025 [Syntrophomonadaceae bacterium]|nr:hypothetical protein [Syntrophomonadaceae bacterium]